MSNLVIIDVASETILGTYPVGNGARGTASLKSSAVSWLSNSPTSGTVAIGDSTNISVAFNANGLNSGIFETELLITSDDPNATQVTIPIVMNVVGDPEIVLSDSCLAFDTIFVGNSLQDSIAIHNKGCDTLFLTGFNSTSGDFDMTFAATVIPPDDSTRAYVNYNPSTATTFSDSIEILNNASQVFICLNATSIEPPGISVAPDFLSATVTNCGDSVSVDFTVYNTGLGELIFNIGNQKFGLSGDSSILVIQDQASWNSIWMDTYFNSNFPVNATRISSSQISTTDLMHYDIVVTAGSQLSTYYNLSLIHI